MLLGGWGGGGADHDIFIHDSESWSELIFCDLPSTYVLINDNSQVRKNILILTLYRMKIQEYCDVFKWTLWMPTSQEVKCDIRRHQGAK